MLDENLPTFFIKSTENDLQQTVFIGQGGNDLKPEYTIKKPNPSLPAAKNCYAIAICDSYNPDVLFAEVLVSPEWTRPTLSAAEIRAQNGIPPPPVPLVPSDFTIQLYNPDQQVKVKQIDGKAFSSAYWEFEMPQQTFRMPSASALDRTQNDPAALDITPKVSFKWKRDSKINKNISCYLGGKSTNGRKGKEPDITLAMFKSGKELTVYEPNMHRVEVEDSKGLEVVMILGAIVIRDIFFDASREMFNISGTPAPSNTRKNSGPVIGGKSTTNSHSAMATSGTLSTSPPPQRIPQSQIPPAQAGSRPHASSRPPPADARTQWEIDAETERLRKIVEREEKERARAEKEEERRIKKMLEAEEKEQRRKQAQIDRETELLRRQYGVQSQSGIPSSNPPQMPPRPAPNQTQSGAGRVQGNQPYYQPVPRPMSTGATLVGPFNSPSNWMPASMSGANGAGSSSTYRPPPQQFVNGPYLQTPNQGGPSASSSGFFGLGKKVQKKRSVFF